MIYPMRVYDKDGNLVKTVPTEVLEKIFWEKFWAKEDLNAYNKNKKRTKVKQNKPVFIAA